MMNFFRLWLSKHSLKFQLNLSILTFVSIGFLCLVVFISRYTAPILETQLNDNAKKSIDAYVADFSHMTIHAERVILNTKNTLSQMSEDNVEAIKMLLNSVIKTVSHTDLDFVNTWLYVFQPEDVATGDLYISTDYNGDGVFDFNIEHINNLYDVFPWFKEVPRKEDIYWSEPYLDKETSRPVVTCLIPFKFFTQTDFNGLLALTIDLTDIQKRISDFSFYESGKLILLSRSGLYVNYPDPDVALKLTIFDLAEKLQQPDLKFIGKELAAGRGGQIVVPEIPVFHNGAGVFFYEPIKHLGWSFCLVYAQKEFMKPIRQFQAILGLALFVIVIFLLLMISRICHYSTRQLQMLSRVAALYGRGRFKQSVKFIPNSSDIGMLVCALTSMRTNLLSYIDKERKDASEKQKNQSELDIARHIQKSALSTTYPDNGAFNIATTMIPAQQVGGDFYNFFFIDKYKFAIVIADVSGKGIPATLYMMKALTLIKNISLSKKSLDFVFQRVNEQLYEGNDTCMFVTAFMAVIDLKDGTTTYINAGHNPPLVGDENGYQFMKTKRNIILGVNPKAKFVEEKMQLKIGNHLFLYTDGVTEAENNESKFYGEKRLLKVFDKAHSNPQDNINMVLKDVQKFVKNNPQSDDITMLDFVFSGNQRQSLTVKASMRQLKKVLFWLKDDMVNRGVSNKGQFSLIMAAEEIFSNIVSYAYDKSNRAEVKIETNVCDGIYEATFIDSGKKFNPLKRKNPDINAKIEDRNIGGLGVFLVKKISDTMTYSYKDGYNILKVGVRIDR